MSRLEPGLLAYPLSLKAWAPTGYTVSYCQHWSAGLVNAACAAPVSQCFGTMSLSGLVKSSPTACRG